MLRRAILLALAISLLPLFASSQGTVATKSADEEEVARPNRYRYQPYCGLYCLYTVFRLHGVEINFKDLLDEGYFDGSKGSSLQHLIDAANSRGFYTMPLKNMNADHLRHSKSPVILHVKASPNSDDYDHYELYLGSENGHARIYDPPTPIRLEPFSEVEERWSGTGLVVSSVPISKFTYIAAAMLRVIPYGVGIMLLAFVLLLVRRRKATSEIDTLT